MKLFISRAAIEKLFARFREVCANPTERDERMIEWFTEFLSDDASPVDRVVRQLGKVKPGWERQLSQVEMHELNGSLETLATFTDSEWQDIADWLNYKPKSWEKLYQVQNRASFLRAPIDTLTAAEAWRDQNKAQERRPSKPVSESAGTVLDRDEALAILRGINYE